MVDPQSLDPLHSSVAHGMRLLKGKIVYHSIDKVLLQDEGDGGVTDFASVPYRPIRNTAESSGQAGNVTSPFHLNLSKDPSLKFTGINFKAFIEGLLREGIQAPGTRYAIQSKLIYHYWSSGYKKEECYDAISNWYFSHDHRSEDWRKSPNRVLRQLKTAIDSLYRNAANKGYRPRSNRSSLLTASDVRNIVEMSPDYRMQKFLFSLLKYALSAKDSAGVFRLPKNAIIKFDACSNTSYQEKMAFCKSMGLIRTVKDYSIAAHRATTYRIDYEFSNDKDHIPSLEEGLNKIFGQQELINRYGRYYALRILDRGKH